MDPKPILDQNSPKPSLGKKIAKLLLVLLSLCVLMLIVAIIGLNVYLNSNQTKLFEQLSFLNKGSVSFESASFSVFRDFPSATLNLNSVIVYDSLFEQHEIPLIKVDQLKAAISLKELLSNSIEVQSITLKDGSIDCFKDLNGYQNLLSIIHAKEANKKEEKLKINTDEIDLHLYGIDIKWSDAISTFNFDARANQLNAHLKLSNKNTLAQLNMDLFINELVFKREEGAYLTDSEVIGKPNLEIIDYIVYAKPFDLQINQQHFIFSTEFDTKKREISKLSFENHQSSYADILVLVPLKLQEQLKPYHIERPFYSKMNILSHFRPNENPYIEIDYLFHNNQIKYNDLVFDEVSMKGFYANRIFTDERAKDETKDRRRFELKDIQMKYEDFSLRSDSAYITRSLVDGILLDLDLHVNGEAKGISQWLKNNQFFFEKGKFDLTTQIKGPLKAFNELILTSDGRLNLKDFSVKYKPANVSFPFKKLSLAKKASDANFTIVSDEFNKGNLYTLAGSLGNLPALLFELPNESAKSQITFESSKLRWQDFLDLFGQNGYLKNIKLPESKKKQTMKETIIGVESNFKPRLTVTIDTFQYYNLMELLNFETEIHFEDENTVVLDNTRFDYEEGSLVVSAKMDISNPNQTPFEIVLETEKINLQKLLPSFDYFNIKLLENIESYPENVSVSIKHKGVIDDQKGLIPNTSNGEIVFKINEGQTLLGKVTYEADHSDLGEKTFSQSYVNTQLELEGAPSLFNEFFQSDEFFFEEGRFFVEFQYKGNVSSFEELLNEGSAALLVENSNVYYEAADINFPLTKIELDLQEDNANFNLFSRSDRLDQQILLNGSVQNLSEILIGETGKDIKTSVELSSPKLVWNTFLEYFTPEDIDIKNSQVSNVKTEGLKKTVKGMLNEFDPSLFVKVDTFIYSDKLQFRDLSTGVYMFNKNTVVLDKTGFTFRDGNMSVNGRADLGHKETIPFNADFHTDDLDVAALLESLNYLNSPELQNIEKISGRITMDLNLSGIISEPDQRLISEATIGTLDFNLQNVELKGYATLDSITKKIGRKKRFEDIRFAPISNQVLIKGQELDIPLMEIQSNAINMFVEGKMSYGNNTNIWVSIPLDNLKAYDGVAIPDKRGYIDAKRKVFVEISSDENRKSKFQFRLRKKKFYEDRGILDEYKKDRKRYRELWKKARKK